MRNETPIKSQAAKVLDQAIVAVLFLLFAAAPLSIAASQTAWLVGIALWLVRFIFYPRPKLYRTPIDYFLFGFFILTGLSAFLSYEPMVSIGKLRAASLFTVVYLVSQNIPSVKIARLLAATLIGSCALTGLYSAGERAFGRGVKVYGVSERSSLYRAGIRDNDTLLQVDGEKLRDPQQLVDALSQASSKPADVKVYRFEWQPTFKVPRGNMQTGNTPVEQLGIGAWSIGRDWRASGFLGHYVTYAEVVQLVLALTLGMFVALNRKRSWMGLLLFVALVSIAIALLLTITRAAWLGCLFSSIIIMMLSLRRRTLMISAAIVLPLVLAGLFVLQQKRNVGFLDSRDQSTTWRTTVWREGFQLLTSNPRHLLVGVGMDSIKARWREWGMFEGGRIPRGHMHSNFLQIALERGIPALLVWLGLLVVYGRAMWRSLRSASDLNWADRGILLGALGGMVGFVISGLVHYNWGDSEVVTVFYLIVGLSLFIHRNAQAKSAVSS